MSKELTTKQKAHRLVLAAKRGESARSYMERVGWDYLSTRLELVRTGDWNRIMAAKYEVAQ